MYLRNVRCAYGVTELELGELGMERETQMVIRYLAHSGKYEYYSGTNNKGEAEFGTIEDARIFTATSAQRIMALCMSQDFDVELITYSDSLRVVA